MKILVKFQKPSLVCYIGVFQISTSILVGKQGCTSCRDFGPEKGGLEPFCLKICDVLAHQDEFSTALRLCLVVRKVRNERNLS